jgi:hypothetical protein
MLRLGLAAAERAGFDSFRARSELGAGAATARLGDAELAKPAAGVGSAEGVGSVAARGGCAAAPDPLSFAATEARPRISPAAAAATIVQREPVGRCDGGGFDDVSSALVTSGASLSGARLDGAVLGGASESMAMAAELDGTSAWGAGGVGMARNVIFSFALGGAGSFGGGGGMLERSSGMCSDSGASPPRTTTACRGGDFKPGRAMKPPRGVMASAETGAESSGSSSSCE